MMFQDTIVLNKSTIQLNFYLIDCSINNCLVLNIIGQIDSYYMWKKDTDNNKKY